MNNTQINPSKHVVGLFHNPAEARRAIEALRDAGFSAEQVGVLSRDSDTDPEIKSIKELSGNNLSTGAAVGAAAGAGGGALWALGIAAGILPAIGPVIAGGVLAAIAASAAVGAAGGVIAGALTGMGISDEQAAYYSEEFDKGRVLVVVETKDRFTDAHNLLLKFNSYNRFYQNQPRTGTGTGTLTDPPRPM